MAWVPYDKFKTAQFNGNAIDFDTDTIRWFGATSGHTLDRASHEFKSHLSNEISGTNYTAGGPQIASVSLSITSNVLKFDCADVTFLQSGAGFTNLRYLIMYKDTGVAGTSRLIAYYDLGSDKGNVAGDLILQTPNGVFTV